QRAVGVDLEDVGRRGGGQGRDDEPPGRGGQARGGGRVGEGLGGRHARDDEGAVVAGHADAADHDRLADREAVRRRGDDRHGVARLAGRAGGGPPARSGQARGGRVGEGRGGRHARDDEGAVVAGHAHAGDRDLLADREVVRRRGRDGHGRARLGGPGRGGGDGGGGGDRGPGHGLHV